MDNNRAIVNLIHAKILNTNRVSTMISIEINHIYDREAHYSNTR